MLLGREFVGERLRKVGLRIKCKEEGMEERV